jgi:hypothetical protein
MHLSRRRFLVQAATLAAGSTFPLPVRAADEKPATGKVRIGLIADIHQDIMHDAPERLGHFLKEAAIHQAHPFIAFTAPYRDALFTFLEIDLDARTFTLSAARSEWVGHSPQEMNAMYPGIENDRVVPACSAKESKLPG